MVEKLCKNCMFYDNSSGMGLCRFLPTANGFPRVKGKVDWCSQFNTFSPGASTDAVDNDTP